MKDADHLDGFPSDPAGSSPGDVRGFSQRGGAASFGQDPTSVQ
jgi:hypothetical protein